MNVKVISYSWRSQEENVAEVVVATSSEGGFLVIKGHLSFCRLSKYCDQRVCVFVFVCLSLPLAYVKNHTSKFHPIFYTCCFWRGSVLLWRQYDTLRYVLSVLWMTSCFHMVEGTGQNQGRRALFRPFRYVAAPGAKYAVSDCIWL